MPVHGDIPHMTLLHTEVSSAHQDLLFTLLNHTLYVPPVCKDSTDFTQGDCDTQ